ncbi:protein GUCD1-like isoform X2 [Teleopsis dalmanni]|uniref:protein GUCD1-like isoform X2 n=1 Tax=Teleopsis dalmanni TaxID=139649 RepID=UPI0018CCC115|nr:protein GUCD1-like isoform X2 [Teleopsis dalmanni]XP_037935748.1 protein GUCD1-like isoform X2 [Teleopsis dalmanni]
MEAIPPQKHYNLTHYQQRYNWDCGISCILMILTSTQRQHFIDNFLTICKEEGFGSSTWSIDLCYLLRRYDVRHEYFTKTLGIDPNYNQHSYYTKIIDKDEKRVTRKFKEASSHGIRVEQRTVDMQTLIHHLGRKGPIIMLTNASLLTCEICKKHVLENFGYAGHYIVLCGYDIKLNKIFYRNPEVHDGHVCQCSTASLDVARKAYGTDEDVIFIFPN